MGARDELLTLKSMDFVMFSSTMANRPSLLLGLGFVIAEIATLDERRLTDGSRC
jgi:hypothetical protein